MYEKHGLRGKKYREGILLAFKESISHRTGENYLQNLEL